MTPALTTVRQPLAEMGRMAVSLLTRLLENHRFEALHVELATQLIVRSSVALAGVARQRAAARSNSARASSKRPSFARRSPRTLGRRW